MSPFVSNADLTKRLGICAQCMYFKRIIGRCGICGCPLLVKASLKASECPEGKWEQYKYN